MAKPKTPAPKNGYRDGSNLVFLWRRDAATVYNHFDLIWGVRYLGTWDESTNSAKLEAPDPLYYFHYGMNKTGEMGNYGNSATSSFAKSFNPNDWYPFQNRITSGMWFRVRGDTAAQEASTASTRSDYSLAGSDHPGSLVTLKIPDPPALSTTRSGGSTTLTWRSPNDEQDLKWCSEVQVQTRLGSESWKTIEQDATWASGESVTGRNWREPSGSCTLTESASTQAGTAPRTRRYRARCRGPRGASRWVEVDAWNWAKPVAPVPDAKKSGRNATWDVLYWSYAGDKGHPAERVVVERCVGTPESAAEVPPASASWTADTPVALESQTANSKHSNHIPVSTVGEDECVWMRATAHHGELSAASAAIVTHRGRLAAPRNLTATRNQSSCTLEWTDGTSVPGAQVFIYMRESNEADWDECFHGPTSAVDSRSKTVTGLKAGADYDFKVVHEKKGWTTSYGAYALDQGRPAKPTIDAMEYDEKRGHVFVKWSLADGDAVTRSVELSWSADGYAWASTGGYSSTVFEGRATQRYIDGAEAGTWVYARVRGLSDDGLPGEWSDRAQVLCATTPAKPTLQASRSAIKPGDPVGFAWSYDNADGSALSRSVLHVTRAGATVNTGRGNGATQGTIWGSTTKGWTAGQDVLVTVSVTSANGKTSPESDPVIVEVMALPSPSRGTAQVPVLGNGTGAGFTSLPYVTTTTTEGTGKVRTLQVPPLSVRATSGGVGDGGTVTIRRAAAQRVERGDGTVDRTSEDEAVAAKAWWGASDYVQFEGVVFDEDGLYYAEIEAYNAVGSAVVRTEPFHVSWSARAVAPAPDALHDGTEAYVWAESGRSEPDDGEMLDIYRITADGLQLVYANAQWGVLCTDPYAPLGKEGPTHRAVSRMPNGHEAWADVDAGNPQQGIVIDWDGKQVSLPYNLQVSDGYSKRHATVRHRGGTVTGRWLEGVQRESSWRSQTIRVKEPEKLLLLRELARWCGECYLRGPGGVGFPCNVDVALSTEHGSGAVDVELTATRIDSDEWGGF